MGVCLQKISGDGPILDEMNFNFENGFIWICGRRQPKDVGPADWYIQGVFTTKQMALDNCINEHYWIGALPLNTSLPHDRIEWPSSCFPLAEIDDSGE